MNKKTPFFKRRWVVFWMLLSCPPVGLYLVYKMMDRIRELELK